MVTVISRLGKIFKIFPLFFFLLNCQKDDLKSNTKILVNQKTDTVNTYVSVKFNTTSTFSLNTLMHQRGKSFSLYGKHIGEQKEISITELKPTVFTNYRVQNNKTISRQYISFGNDRLDFEINKDTSLFVGNRKNNILNELFTTYNDLHYIQNQIVDIAYLNDLYAQHQYRLQKLHTYAGILNETEITTVEDYLNLYYFYSVFNIDFSKISSSEVGPFLDKTYKRLLQNVGLLDRINTILTKQIVYNSLRYISYTTNKKPYQCISLVDERLRNTEAMEGFLDDVLRYSSSNLSLEDRKEINKFLPTKTKATIKENTSVLSDSILNQTVKNSKNGELKLKEALATTTENLVLVDLWATWCIPCIKENPDWEKAKMRYKGKIKFVKISIDRDKDKWEKYLKKSNVAQDNFLIDHQNHLFIQFFNVNAIPRFILFNNQFQILSKDFTRPSDVVFDSEVQKYLK